MDESFRLRRFYRNLGIFGLVFFGCNLLLVVSFFLWVPAAPPEQQFAKFFLACFFIAGTAIVTASFAWMLLTCRRWSLSVIDGRIIEKGITGFAIRGFFPCL
jgi:hypothetical protein